ncbi:MAG: hypothetical protein LC687_03595, partial [Actinobacteria bacterium]|nr:hypothetical protein [Actinomycetota bacterium]
MLHVVSFPELVHKFLPANEAFALPKGSTWTEFATCVEMPLHYSFICVQGCLFLEQGTHDFDSCFLILVQMGIILEGIADVFLELLGAFLA